jgi:hypothetical protein
MISDKDIKVKNYMFRLLRDLDKKGFVLYYYEAYSTSSCYIKLDFGLSNSIRIADHKGIDKYQYRFNLMIGLRKSYVKDGRNYYCEEDYDKMISDIVAFREEQLDKYGFRYYDYMVKNKNDAENRSGFWKKSRSYNDN